MALCRERLHDGGGFVIQPHLQTIALHWRLTTSAWVGFAAHDAIPARCSRTTPATHPDTVLPRSVARALTCSAASCGTQHASSARGVFDGACRSDLTRGVGTTPLRGRRGLVSTMPGGRPRGMTQIPAVVSARTMIELIDCPLTSAALTSLCRSSVGTCAHTWVFGTGLALCAMDYLLVSLPVYSPHACRQEKFQNGSL